MPKNTTQINMTETEIKTWRRLDTSVIHLSGDVVLVFPTAEALDAFADTVLDLLYLLDDPFDVELTEGTPNGDGSNM